MNNMYKKYEKELPDLKYLNKIQLTKDNVCDNVNYLIYSDDDIKLYYGLVIEDNPINCQHICSNTHPDNMVRDVFFGIKNKDRKIYYDNPEMIKYFPKYLLTSRIFAKLIDKNIFLLKYFTTMTRTVKQEHYNLLVEETTNNICSDNIDLKKVKDMFAALPTGQLTYDFCFKFLAFHGKILKYIPQHIWNQFMVNKALELYPNAINYIYGTKYFNLDLLCTILLNDDIILKLPMNFYTQEICDRICSVNKNMLQYIPNKFIKHTICNIENDVNFYDYVYDKFIKNDILLCICNDFILKLIKNNMDKVCYRYILKHCGKRIDRDLIDDKYKSLSSDNKFLYLINNKHKAKSIPYVYMNIDLCKKLVNCSIWYFQYLPTKYKTVEWLMTFIDDDKLKNLINDWFTMNGNEESDSDSESNGSESQNESKLSESSDHDDNNNDDNNNDDNDDNDDINITNDLGNYADTDEKFEEILRMLKQRSD